MNILSIIKKLQISFMVAEANPINFDACSFNTISVAFRVKKLQESSQLDDSLG